MTTDPSAALTPDPGPMRLTEEDLAALKSARSWARLMYIVMLIGTISMVVITLVVVAAGKMAPIEKIVTAVAGALGLGFLGFYAWLLGRYTAGIAAHLAGDSGGLVRAFRALKVWWIFLVVGGALGSLSTLIMILALLAGIKAGAEP